MAKHLLAKEKPGHSQLVIKNNPPGSNNLLTAAGYNSPIRLPPSRVSSLKQMASIVPLSVMTGHRRVVTSGIRSDVDKMSPVTNNGAGSTRLVVAMLRASSVDGAE